MKTIDFYYVRHGETIFNVINRSQGSCDSPLTSQGIQQAKQCAKHLKAFHFDKAFCSTSERAIDTAEIILKDRNVQLIRLKGLKEMSFGLLEGSKNDDLSSPMSQCWINKDFTEYGGENREQFKQRIQETFSQIVESCSDNESCLIVSHRGYFYYMLEALFGENLDLLEKEKPNILNDLIPNASVAQFQFKDGKWILLELPKAK